MSYSSKPAKGRSSEERQLAEELVERVRSAGVDLVGPDGLLSWLTKNVLEAGLEAERPLSRRKRGRPRRVFAATELIDLLSNQ